MYKNSEDEQSKQISPLQKSEQIDRQQPASWHRSIFLCCGINYLIVMLIIFFIAVAEKPSKPPITKLENSQIFTNLIGILIYANGTRPIVNDTEYWPHEQVMMPDKYRNQWTQEIVSIQKFDKYGLVQLFKQGYGGNYSIVEWAYPNRIEATFQFQQTVHLHLTSDCFVKPLYQSNVGTDGYLFATCPGNNTVLYHTGQKSNIQKFPYSFDGLDVVKVGESSYLLVGIDFKKDISGIPYAQIYIFICNVDAKTSPCYFDSQKSVSRVYDIDNFDLAIQIDPYTIQGFSTNTCSFRLVVQFARGEDILIGTVSRYQIAKEAGAAWTVVQDWSQDLQYQQTYQSIDFGVYNGYIYYILQTTIENQVYVYRSDAPTDNFYFQPVSPIIQVLRSDDQIVTSNRTVSKKDRLIIYSLADRIQLYDMQTGVVLDQHQILNMTVTSLYFNKFQF